MNTISATMPLDTMLEYRSATSPLRAATISGVDAVDRQATPQRSADTRHANDVRAKYTEFVGQTFFSQMLKAMRSTQGKPAYFHGGRSEEVFQGQLDQMLVDNLSAASADRFARPMFEHQFPHLARALRENGQQSSRGSLAELGELRRP